VTGSNLYWDNGYPIGGISWFPFVPSGTCWYSTSN